MTIGRFCFWLCVASMLGWLTSLTGCEGTSADYAREQTQDAGRDWGCYLDETITFTPGQVIGDASAKVVCPDGGAGR